VTPTPGEVGDAKRDHEGTRQYSVNQPRPWHHSFGSPYVTDIIFRGFSEHRSCQ
jgi:hypothetical protein